MLSRIQTIALLSFAAAATLGAQGPGGPPPAARTGGPEGRSAPAAKLLLSNTAELDLTDAQVVRLAAIARRSEARRRSMRASMDSARTRFGQPNAGDSVARRQFRDRMRTDMDRAADQMRADQRDAIAVLTPDQQGRAWELVSNRGGGMGRGMRRGGIGARRGVMRPGRGIGARGGMDRGFGPRRRGGDVPPPARPPRPPVE
jgi:Spy/CpxP family protein refolding chaperone